MWCSASSPQLNVRERARVKVFMPEPYASADILNSLTSTATGTHTATEATTMTTATGSRGRESVSAPDSLFRSRITAAASVETLQSFLAVQTAWRSGNIAAVDSALAFCEDYLDPQTLDRIPYFVGCGGVGLFCELLCDPVVFEGRRARAFYINVLSCLMVVLTEVIVRHNNISWYIYDRYPCVFFRLVELLGVAHLNNSALSMLEHLLSVVGPVLEIAKTTSLVSLVRSDITYLLGGLCRVLALLVIPGNALQQSCTPSRHLLYPEVLYPIRRVQRVVDSNVLWMQSEAGVVDRLIGLCEVRSREIRVQQGGRTTTVMAPPSQATPGTAAASFAAELEGAATATLMREELQTLFAQLSQLPASAGLDVQAVQAQLATLLGETAFAPGGAPALEADTDEWYDEEEEDEEDEGDEEYDDEWETDEEGEYEDAEEEESTEDEETGYTDASTDVLNSIQVPSPRNPISTSSSSFWDPAVSTHGAAPLSGAETSDVRSPLTPPRPATSLNANATPFTPASHTPIGAPTATHVPVPVQVPASSPAPAPAPAPATNLALGDTNEATARVVQELINEEAMIENEMNTKIDLNWYYGCIDARERWRLRDLTLTPEKDDTRPMLFGFGSLRDDDASRAFKTASEANMKFLHGTTSSAEFNRMSSTFRHQTVDSQSEVLYVLNVLLSTFYFSDAWHELRRCEWLKRANKIYNTSFGIGKGAPISVDVPRTVTVTEHLRALPRFQPPRVPALTPASDATAGAAPASRPRPRAPVHWPLPPFEEMLGRRKDEFAQDSSVQMLQDEDDFTDEAEHQHSPDTVRKLELLRGLHSFWNAQNGFESRMLDDGKMPQQAAKLSVKIAHMLASNKEDGCVEGAACNVLESYLRTFTHNARARGDWRRKPVQSVGEAVLLNLLHTRLYNATLIPSLSQSIRPLRRFENTFSLLGELFQYDFAHLHLLAEHVAGTVTLAALNAPCRPGNRTDLLVFAPSQEIDAIFETPPLERQENEPFGSVLLRRLFRYGCETNLFVSAMLLSLTPGLRTAFNYAHRPVAVDDESAVAQQENDSLLARWTSVQLPATPNGRVGDLVSGFSRRFAAVRRCSRGFTAELSLAIHALRTTPSSSPTSATPPVRLPLSCASPEWQATVQPLLEALMAELRTLPHRLAPEERPFAGLYSTEDAALLRGTRGLQRCGPPRAWRVPLFGGPAGCPAADEAAQLAALAPIEEALLGEPHKLVYSLLCALNAETMDSTARMSVITTTILTFLREAHLHPDDPEGAIHALLAEIATLAAPTYHAWRKSCRAATRERGGAATATPSAAVSTQLRPAPTAATVRANPAEALPPALTAPTAPPTANSAAFPGQPSVRAPVHAPGRCTCPATQQDPHHRCLALVVFGACHPPNTANQYYRHYGGCFFRNMFRLLCVWIGHYWSCQRYVDTIFYYTEVAFAEYKTIALFLLRELPRYFSTPLLDA